MKKIAVYIAEQQHARLKALAEAMGITQAELLRRFLEEGLASAEEALHQRAHVRERRRAESRAAVRR